MNSPETKNAVVIVDLDVIDPEKHKEYIELITPSVLERGGKYLVRGGSPETLDGHWQSTRIVIMQFPDREIAQAWLNDPELEKIHKYAKRQYNTLQHDLM